MVARPILVAKTVYGNIVQDHRPTEATMQKPP